MFSYKSGGQRWLGLAVLLCRLAVDSAEHAEKFSCEPNNLHHEFMSWIDEMVAGKQFFEVEIEMVDVASQQTHYVHERFDFGAQLDKLLLARLDGGQTVRLESLSDTSQVNTIDGQSFVCQSEQFDQHTARQFADNWVPEQVYRARPAVYRRAIGPIALLLHLAADLSNSHGYKSKDTTRDSYVYNLCFDDFLLKYAIIRSSDQSLMKNVRLYQRMPTAHPTPLALVRQFNFFQQVLSAKPNADQQLTEALPVGHGCHRVSPNAVSSHTLFGQQGDFSYELVRFQPSAAGAVRSTVDNERILFDKLHKFSVYERRDKDETLRQLLVQDTQTLYTVHEQTGECQAERVDKTRVDLSDIRVLFVFWPRLFESDSDYTDLGDRYERDVLCSVREAVIHTLPQDNSLKAKLAVVTHFVPKESFFSHDQPQLLVPIAIRIAFFAETERLKEIAVYTLNVNRFDSFIDHDSLLDLSGCALHTYDYTWIQLRLPAEPDQLERIRYAQRQVQHAVRNALAVSSIRLPTVDVRFESTALYVTVKLLEDPGVLQYFDKQWHRTLTGVTKRMPADSEHLCARQCFRLASCAAFSHCSSLECDLFLDAEFASTQDQPERGVKTDASDQCSTFIRRIGLRSGHDSHLDNRRLISRWQSMIDGQSDQLSIEVPAELSDKIKLTVDMMGVDIRPGRLLDWEDDDDRWNAELEDERNVERYDQLFSIARSNHQFDVESLKAANLPYRELLWLNLYECQLACVNEPQCASYSYCEAYRKCVLSELMADKVELHSTYDAKCMLSNKKLLASFQRYDSRSLSVDAPVSLKSETSLDMDADRCAYQCMNNKDIDCSSFDFCEGETEEGVSQSTCHLHDVHLLSSSAVQWKASETHCDHYAKLHTFDYREYSGESLKENDLGDYEQVSVEKCAALCSDTVDCSTFDYCLHDADEQHVETTTCRLNSALRLPSKVQSSRPCSVYERTGTSARKSVNKSPPARKAGYTKGAVAGLSVLFLFVGFLIGALLSHFVLDKYLRL